MRAFSLFVAVTASPGIVYCFRKSNDNIMKRLQHMYENDNTDNSPCGCHQMKMSNMDNVDLNIIRQSKDFITKDNFNGIMHDIGTNDISKIYVNNDYSEIVSVYEKANNVLADKFHIIASNEMSASKIIDKASELNVPIYFENFTPEFIANIQYVMLGVMKLISSSISLLTFLSIIIIVTNVVQKSYPPLSSMNKSKFPGKMSSSQSNMFNPFNFEEEYEIEFVNTNISLSSWAGSPEVIEECREIISYLENKELFKEIGAEMPKGILLEGPPGTGKTLLAKAIASETNSTFISMAGSEFVEMFVGMGASRVRDLFDSARESRPCIIFIDEIDAIGRQRGSGVTNGGSNEQEQTLNQILYEMDGFNDNEDIVVIAATNRKDILDKALLRPGRFDRIIRIPLPDTESRHKILDYYLNTKKVDANIDTKVLSELTSGFSGAELKNLVNEAAILSARNNLKYIKDEYMFEAFEKSIVGIVKKNAVIDNVTNTRVAIHETGHSLLTLKFREYFDFQKVSINPTYNGAGGYTIFTESPDISNGGLYTRDLLMKRLIILFGGKAAESIYYGDNFVSTGASEDLKEANRLAKRMICNFGMGERLKVSYNENVDEELFTGLTKLGHSDYTNYVTDKEIMDILENAYNEAKRILVENDELFIEFSELLQKHNNLYRKDIQGIQGRII